MSCRHCCDCSDSGYNADYESRNRLERIEKALIKAGLMEAPPPRALMDSSAVFKSLKATLDKVFLEADDTVNPFFAAMERK